MTGLRFPAGCIHEVMRLLSSFVPKPCWQPGVRASMVEDCMQMSRSHLSTCTGNPGRLLYTRGLLLGGCSRGGDSEGGNSGRSE